MSDLKAVRQTAALIESLDRLSTVLERLVTPVPALPCIISATGDGTVTQGPEQTIEELAAAIATYDACDVERLREF
jgi:hypothetical protein